jgi:hypothetical protein
MKTVTVTSSKPDSDIMQCAYRFGAQCLSEVKGKDCFMQSFSFSQGSIAEQFKAAVAWYPNVVGLRVSGDEIEAAIASSRLCDCGWTTKASCERNCSANVGEVKL